MSVMRVDQFGPVWGASGVQGFFGEGYAFHGPWLNFEGMTLVAKTATASKRAGNMPLNDRFRPKQLFPSCVIVQPFQGSVVNAVGLSNPGLKALLATSKWQRLAKPFMISITSVADSQHERLDEYRQMVEMLGGALEDFRAPFGVQVNLSCPNTDLPPKQLIHESVEVLNIVGELGVPVVPKYSISSAPIAAIVELDGHEHCQAISVSNSIPFGWSGIDWTKAWGGTISPLAHLGGGGLSGAPLLSVVRNYIAQLRQAGYAGHINGGGGILQPRDCDVLREAGASSISLGSIAIVRPWRVAKTIAYARSLQWE